MAGNSCWDNRRMFERYLYDYLKKNNMHETAEIFKNEANMTINPDTPPGIDVQDGFLREWWLILYDIFTSRHPITNLYDECCFSMTNPVTNMAQQNVFLSSRERKLNEEMIKELTVDSDIGIIIDEGKHEQIFTPTGGNSIENERIFEDSKSAELQKKESESMPVELLGQLGDLAAQKRENIAPNESGEKIKNSVDSSEDESNGIKLIVSYSSSKATSPISSSIEVSTSCTSVNSDFLDAPTVEESER